MILFPEEEETDMRESPFARVPRSSPRPRDLGPLRRARPRAPWHRRQHAGLGVVCVIALVVFLGVFWISRSAMWTRPAAAKPVAVTPVAPAPVVVVPSPPAPPPAADDGSALFDPEKMDRLMFKPFLDQQERHRLREPSVTKGVQP